MAEKGNANLWMCLGENTQKEKQYHVSRRIEKKIGGKLALHLTENLAFPYWHDQQNLPLRVNKENANEGKPVFVFIGKRCSAVECTI